MPSESQSMKNQSESGAASSMAAMAAATSVPDRRGAIVLFALFLSGIGGIVNQVVWQRALKIFLGGSEALSSMVVVLVFMLGLGVGAAVAGARIHRVSHPLRAFGWVELSLALVNLGVATVLALDIRETVYTVQGIALSVGVPLRLVYGLGALSILFVPTFLMCVTLPIASEVFQRQLGAARPTTIPLVFFLNTVGAAVGAFGASFYLLPYHGQWIALVCAVFCSLLAAAVLLILSLRVPSADSRALPERPVRSAAVFTLGLEERLGCLLGFLSLGYEMILFRVMALAHLPLPYTFAITLCFFLLFWSVGVYAASFLREKIPAGALVGAVLVGAMPVVYGLDRWQFEFEILGGVLLYFLPCLVFGLLYGHLVSRSAKSWGNDVGRFYAVNTAGACAGILFFTLVGYEIPQSVNSALIAVGLLFVSLHFVECGRPSDGQTEFAPVARGRARLGQRGLALGMLALLVAGGLHSTTESGGIETFWGRDGVVEVSDNGDIHIDGLWHSTLSDGQNHIGRRYSWFMAVAALSSHGDAEIEDALVIGSGVGLTATSLTKIAGVQVDAYEINQTLRRVMQRHPEGSLGALDNPRIHTIWRDARSGLALDPKRYDIIISAPLHLRQAGSSILLSREYLELVRSRLKPGGVVALYSFEGQADQSLLVRHTVESVFRYGETFEKGLVTVASDSPIDLDPLRVRNRLRRAPDLMREARIDLASRGGRLLDALDSPRLRWGPIPYVITDDHPLVEYPRVVTKLLARAHRQ